VTVLIRSQVIRRRIDEVFDAIVDGGNFAGRPRARDAPKWLWKLVAPMIGMIGRKNLRDTANALQTHLER
jgi:hypothetical protein